MGGRICSYGRACKRTDCFYEHPAGRCISALLQPRICSFGKKCNRADCMYTHPEGRDIDADPLLDLKVMAPAQPQNADAPIGASASSRNGRHSSSQVKAAVQTPIGLTRAQSSKFKVR